MSKLELNGERRRTKTSLRRRWAKPLIRPQTLKLVIKVGQGIVKILQLIFSIIKIFRE